MFILFVLFVLNNCNRIYLMKTFDKILYTRRYFYTVIILICNYLYVQAIRNTFDSKIGKNGNR